MKISREEQETIFRTSADSKEFDFYTRDPKFVRRLRKRGYVVEIDHHGLFSARLPLKALTVRSAHRASRKHGPVGGFGARKGIVREEGKTNDRV